MASRKPGRELISNNELAKARETMSKIMAEKMKELDSSSTSDGRLSEIEEGSDSAEAAMALATRGRTRDLLALRERELEQLTAATSTRTREKLAKVEAAIAANREEFTSTQTRIEFQQRQKLFEDLIKQNSHVDLVFLMDCTGSMGPYIESCKNQITDIVNTCVETFENQMRIGFVGYRDHCDGNSRIAKFDLTEDYYEMISFLGNVHATGGGDSCEDVFGGLEAIISLCWKHPNRILIHVGDAPQHGSRFNGGYNDEYSSYNEADPRGLTIESLIGNLKQLKVRYFFAKLNSSTDTMIREFKKVSGSDDYIQEIDLKNPGDIFNLSVYSVTMTIDARISTTVSCSGNHVQFGHTEVKEFSIIENGEIPDLEDCRLMTVQWLECKFPDECDVKNIKAGINGIRHKWRNEVIKKADNPFAEGTQRVSFHGLRGEDEEQIVMKELKASRGRDSRQEYIITMEMQAVAAFMAFQFNKIAPSEAKAISFLEVSLVQATNEDGSPLYYNVEKLLPDYQDRFTKWSNNTGYVNTKHFAASLAAFCHWTYDATNGYLMVVDIQGVAQDDADAYTYALTDPCIHCKDDIFGRTNYGKAGMKRFFKTHMCSKICEDLGLKPNKHQPSKGIFYSLMSMIPRVS